MNEFSAKQIQAIGLLAHGVSCRDVAKELSVAPQTISEWKKSPSFVARVNDLKMEALETARIALQQSSNIAVRTLIEIAEKSDNDETRRKAAMDILRMNGFEAGMHESFAWGVGSRTEERMKHEMDGTIDLHDMLKMNF